jgi:hypothetical protein
MRWMLLTTLTACSPAIESAEYRAPVPASSSSEGPAADSGSSDAATYSSAYDASSAALEASPADSRPSPADCRAGCAAAEQVCESECAASTNPPSVCGCAQTYASCEAGC